MIDLRELMYRRRWAICRTVKDQSVAEHSYFVTIYAHQIATWLNATNRVEKQVCVEHVVYMALVHDWEESFTGDIPGPVKHKIAKTGYSEYLEKGVEDRFSGYSLISFYGDHRDDYTENRILKIANLIDEVCYLTEERRMGNRFVIEFLDISKARLQLAIEGFHTLAPKHRIMLTLEVQKILFSSKNVIALPPRNNDDLAS